MSLPAGVEGLDLGVSGEGRYSAVLEGRSGTGGVELEWRGGEPLGVWAVDCGDMSVSSVLGLERDWTSSGVLFTMVVDVGDSVGTWTLGQDHGQSKTSLKDKGTHGS